MWGFHTCIQKGCYTRNTFFCFSARVRSVGERRLGSLSRLAISWLRQPTCRLKTVSRLANGTHRPSNTREVLPSHSSSIWSLIPTWNGAYIPSARAVLRTRYAHEPSSIGLSVHFFFNPNLFSSAAPLMGINQSNSKYFVPKATLQFVLKGLYSAFLG